MTVARFVRGLPSLAFTLLATSLLNTRAEAQGFGPIGGFGGQLINNISNDLASIDPTNRPHPPSVSTIDDPQAPSRPTYQPPPPQQTYQPLGTSQAPTYVQPPYQPYQPQQPAYQPQQPAYQPYQPQQPAYQPYQPTYQPQQPAYQPYQPAYQPQQPAYQPTYQPQQPYSQQNPGAALGAAIGDVIQAAIQ